MAFMPAIGGPFFILVSFVHVSPIMPPVCCHHLLLGELIGWTMTDAGKQNPSSASEALDLAGLKVRGFLFFQQRIIGFVWMLAASGNNWNGFGVLNVTVFRQAAENRYTDVIEKGEVSGVVSRHFHVFTLSEMNCVKCGIVCMFVCLWSRPYSLRALHCLPSRCCVVHWGHVCLAVSSFVCSRRLSWPGSLIGLAVHGEVCGVWPSLTGGHCITQPSVVMATIAKAALGSAVSVSVDAFVQPGDLQKCFSPKLDLN